MQEAKFEPKTNQLNVSQSRSIPYFIRASKQYLDKFPTVELHSIGYAMNIAIRVADILVA